jgi:hypothetical protein
MHLFTNGRAGGLPKLAVNASLDGSRRRYLTDQILVQKTRKSKITQINQIFNLRNLLIKVFGSLGCGGVNLFLAPN